MNTKGITLNRRNHILRDGQPTGYKLSRGAYQGTTDDRMDRWYVDAVDGATIDRRGPGYATKRAALDDLAALIRPCVG